METEQNIDGQETEINDGITLSEEEVVSTDESQELEGVQEESAETGETAEATSEEAGEVVLKDDTQDKINEKINKSYREKKEAQELAEAEKKRREELEVKLKELQKVEVPEVPDLPDPLDIDFEEQMAKRDEILRLNERDRAEKQALQQLESEKAEAAQRQREQHINDIIKGFDERTEVLKLDKATLDNSQNVVQSYIPGKPQLAEYLLADENGPLNVLYLSQNLQALEKVSTMSEAQAAVYIATQIAPEAQKLKPKITQAPPPAYDAQGNSKTKDEHPMLKGATFT